MGPAAIALDGQALQDGSGASPSTRRRVADLAADLARRERLVAVLLAPELPAPRPDALPPELSAAGGELLQWDGRPQVRRLLEAHRRLIHWVPAPTLQAGVGDPGGMLASAHWSDAPVARLVTLDAEDAARLRAPTPRLAARLEWIRNSDLIEMDPALEPARLGIPASRLVPPGQAVEHLEAATAPTATTATTDPTATTGPTAPTDTTATTGTTAPTGTTVTTDTTATPRLALKIAVFGPFPPGGGGIGAYNARFVEALATCTGPGSCPVQVDAVTTTGFAWAAPAGVNRIHAESFGTDIRPASYDVVVYTLGNSDGHLATVEAALRHSGWLWLHEARLAAVATTALDHLSDSSFDAHMARLLERAYPGRPPVAAARTAGRSHLGLAAAGVGLTGPLTERAAGLFVNSAAARRALVLDLPPLAWRPPITVLPPACPPLRPTRRGHAAEPDRPDDLAVAFGVVSMGKRPDLLVDAVASAGCRLAFVGPCPEVLQMVIRDRAAARRIGERVEVVGAVADQAWWDWMERATVAVQMRDSAGGEMSAAVLDALAAGVPVLTNLASTADYPEGTVERLSGGVVAGAPAAQELAAALTALLADPARRQALSEAGRRFAAGHQMEDLADAVVAAVGQSPN